MFACINDRSVCKTEQSEENDVAQALLDLAFTFSPLVEQTTANTIVLNISGQDLIFGSRSLSGYDRDSCSLALAHEIARRASQLGLAVNISVAANPDAAIHAARALKAVTVISPGKELLKLGDLSLKMLDYSLVGIEQQRAEEISAT